MHNALSFSALPRNLQPRSKLTPVNQPILADFKTIRGAAGFFRVGQTAEGTWWFIDPEDRAFFSCGVERVNLSGRAGGDAAAGAYAAAVARRYGPDDPMGWEEGVWERLAAWNLNTVGAWSAPELRERVAAYTEIVSFHRACPAAMIKLAGARVPDVFDPKWVDAVGERASEVALEHHGRRNLLGYFTDHGLEWAQPELRRNAGGTAARPVRPTLLQICLSLGPAFPAWHAAWEFVLAAHGDVAAVARAWEIELPNKEALRQMTEADTAIETAGYLRDHARFSEEFARRYFVTCGAALRRADPDRLVLGCRFARPPGLAVLGACVYPHVDVVSADWIPGAGVETIAGELPRVADLPLLFTNFSWVTEADDDADLSPDPTSPTRVERLLTRGREMWRAASAHSAVIGYAWPHWVDEPEDCPPFGQGLVHVDDREAAEHTELLSRLNAGAAELHRESLSQVAVL